MSHFETPFHVGPFASQAQQYAASPSSSNNPTQFAATASTPTATASAPLQPQASPYAGINHPSSRPPPPHFNDGLMQHQHQQAQGQAPPPPHFSPAASYPGGQQSPYTSAPFTQSVTSTSATPTPPLQQQHHQQQQSAVRHSASPQQLTSPYAGPQNHYPQQPQHQQQYQQHQPQQPPKAYPMAAPPLPHTPSASQHAGPNATGSPQTPQSPGTQAREQKRVELLLEINMELLQEINTLQAQGRGGAMNPQHQLQLQKLNMDDSMAAEEYIQCLRRVQANLAYLAPRMDPQQAAKAPPGPAHMSPPSHMPQLQTKYEQLKELFPGWPGLENRMAQNAGSPRTGQMNAMNGMNPQTTQAQA